MIDDKIITKIQKLATKATPLRWESTGVAVMTDGGQRGGMDAICTMDSNRKQWHANADYIEAVQPQNVLAIIARMHEAEFQNDRIARGATNMACYLDQLCEMLGAVDDDGLPVYSEAADLLDEIISELGAVKNERCRLQSRVFDLNVQLLGAYKELDELRKIAALTVTSAITTVSVDHSVAEKFRTDPRHPAMFTDQNYNEINSHCDDDFPDLGMKRENTFNPVKIVEAGDDGRSE